MASNVRYSQQRQTMKALRGQLAGLPMIFLLSWLVFAFILAFLLGESLRWLGWILGALLAAAFTYGLVALRMKQLAKNSDAGSLQLDDHGLTATYGGVTRHLAWDDITEIAHIPYPSSSVGDTTSIGGAIMSSAVTAANRAAATKPLGVVGPGDWKQVNPTLEGQKLMMEANQQLGTDAQQGRALVPIWFIDYEVEEAELLAQIRARRPDLQVP